MASLGYRFLKKTAFCLLWWFILKNKTKQSDTKAIKHVLVITLTLLLF
jgi:hypothetical protein